MMRMWAMLAYLVAAHPLLPAATLRVPEDHATIQAAIDASRRGDTVLVAPGTYRERIRLKPGVALCSEEAPTKQAAAEQTSETDDRWQRASRTILDGGGGGSDAPGVQMAEGSSLVGFTITRVGLFEESVWKRHFESHGEELGDDEGAVHAEGTTPAIGIRGVSCVVKDCIVHDNGDVGIGILGVEAMATRPLVSGNLVYRNLGGGIGVAEGAEARIEGNTCKENLRAGIGCRNAHPMVADNLCEGNVRAGIGCREGARPVLRGNRCMANRRAGIGIRMEGTSPLVEDNECQGNEMAGIGCRDGASPVLRQNVCVRNKMAGIGCDGARPLIVGNRCVANEMAGIGIEAGSDVVLRENHCLDNRLVAIGVTHESNAVIQRNQLSRSGGVAPIIAVRDQSSVLIEDNQIAGGGVAALLVQGRATIVGNQFRGLAENQGNGIWLWKDAVALVSENQFDGYRSAVVSKEANVVVTKNQIRRFQQSAIIIRDSTERPTVFGNEAWSSETAAQVLQIEGLGGIDEKNTLHEQ